MPQTRCARQACALTASCRAGTPCGSAVPMLLQAVWLARRKLYGCGWPAAQGWLGTMPLLAWHRAWWLAVLISPNQLLHKTLCY
jgi:hypothetical protein